MDTCKVKLTVARCGPGGAQDRGQVIEVGLLEAGRMVAASQCERPEAKTLKAIAAAEAEARTETAAADPATETATETAEV